jgi:hypothetical protein
MAVSLPHLPVNLRMPTAVTIGVASLNKVRTVDTWIYADSIAVGVAQMAVSLSAVTPAVPTAEARRRPHEAVALRTYADGHSYADGHTGGADGIYSDGAKPTAIVGVCVRRRHS